MAQSKQDKKDKAQSFEAVLERLEDYMGWTIVRVPFTPGDVWKTLVRLRVKGSARADGGESCAFRTSLFAFKGGGYFLLVNNALQKAAGIGLGDRARFELEPDLEPRPAELPDELAALLDEEPGLRGWYDSLSESMRREIGKWVLLGKGDEARRNRAAQMAERLLGAMDGERELPPVVEAAFRRRPKARAGWAKMTETQRRTGLLAVFYYQSVEARLRRVEKLCDEAEKRAG